MLNRMERERRTVEAMIGHYCRQQHGTAPLLCGSCTALRDYALQRLHSCPFQADKTTCTKCPIHCYRPAQRKAIKAVMRYAGPRMLYRHPLLAILHLVDSLRSQPTPVSKRPSRSEANP
jgi:hypothetical protein